MNEGRHPPRGTFLGVYDIETTGDLRQTAEFIAREESAGSWSGGGPPTERYARSVAWVHTVQGTGPGRGSAATAVPTANLPGTVLATFRGPRFGVEGTRALAGKAREALLFGAIVKPGAGLGPEEVAERCADAARGGVALITEE